MHTQIFKADLERVYPVYVKFEHVLRSPVCIWTKLFEELFITWQLKSSLKNFPINVHHLRFILLSPFFLCQKRASTSCCKKDTEHPRRRNKTKMQSTRALLPSSRKRDRRNFYLYTRSLFTYFVFSKQLPCSKRFQHSYPFPGPTFYETLSNGPQSFKYRDISIPTAWSNNVRHGGMKSDVHACRFIGLEFPDKFRRAVVVEVNRTVRWAWSKLLSIQAKITFDWKPRDTMALIPSVLVQLERGTWREDCNIISIWLGNEEWIKWVEPNTRTGVGFHINLIENGR